VPATGFRSPWRRELDDLLRGLAGAFLFGAPFLYTMEVWWTGGFASPPRLLAALALTYAALVALTLTAGFRRRQPAAWHRVFGDAAEALAIGLIAATASLTLLRVIHPGYALGPAIGRIVMEGVPFSLGVGIANNFLHRGDDAEAVTGKWHDDGWHGTLVDLGASALGATIVAFSIAPTDEIPMLASGISSLRLIVIIGASLALSYVIVFEANFGSQEARRAQEGVFQTPVGETVSSYLVALATAALMLWLFALVRAGDPADVWLEYTLVLGFPATIGGAAGRLAF
jgi:putative integral membrane protein (TIGR02587 family)